MKTKSFHDYLKTRFTDEEIAEIDRQAQLEVRIFKIIYEKNKKLRRQLIRRIQRSRSDIRAF